MALSVSLLTSAQTHLAVTALAIKLISTAYYLLLASNAATPNLAYSIQGTEKAAQIAAPQEEASKASLYCAVALIFANYLAYFKHAILAIMA